jgi:hypothetical protein
VRDYFVYDGQTAPKGIKKARNRCAAIVSQNFATGKNGEVLLNSSENYQKYSLQFIPALKAQDPVYDKLSRGVPERTCQPADT